MSALPKPYRRPPLPVDGPRRGAAGYYRAAGHAHKAVGGIPLVSAEAAVVAAVRMGYKVAQTQVDRSARLAQRLRKAGDNAAGPDSELKAVDAAERLVIKSAMTGLSWLEAAAAEPGSPIKRLLAAEYRMLGSLFGLNTPKRGSDHRRFGEMESPVDEDPGVREPEVAAASPPEPAEARSVESLVRTADRLPEVGIIHAGKVRQHAVVLFLELPEPVEEHFSVDFICADATARVIRGELFAVEGQRKVLTLTINTAVPSGLWRGCIYLDHGVQRGVQRGVIEIRL